MAPKKKSTMTGDEWGASLAGATHKFKDGPAIGIVMKVERVVSPPFRGKKEDNVQTRIHMTAPDGSALSVYMPERWAPTIAPWTGSALKITSSEPGKVTTRYDVRPAKGAKPLAAAPPIDTVQNTRDDSKRGKGKEKKRAAGNARRALA